MATRGSGCGRVVLSLGRRPRRAAVRSRACRLWWLAPSGKPAPLAQPGGFLLPTCKRPSLIRREVIAPGVRSCTRASTAQGRVRVEGSDQPLVFLIAPRLAGLPRRGGRAFGRSRPARPAPGRSARRPGRGSGGVWVLLRSEHRAVSFRSIRKLPAISAAAARRWPPGRLRRTARRVRRHRRHRTRPAASASRAERKRCPARRRTQGAAPRRRTWPAD